MHVNTHWTKLVTFLSGHLYTATSEWMVILYFSNESRLLQFDVMFDAFSMKQENYYYNRVLNTVNRWAVYTAKYRWVKTLQKCFQ